MHIEHPKQAPLDAEQTKEHLNIFLQQPSAKEVPPCPNCKQHIASMCSPECPEVEFSLSSHPEEFPIEPNIVPLVFGLMSTRVIQTCWSCEGHMDENNNLLNLPMVSFYTSNQVYPQLLHRHLIKLKIDKKVFYSWQIVLTDYAQTWAQTYSIVPDLCFVKEDVRLGALQNDLKIIAENVQEKLKFLAREMIIELDSWIEQQNA